jgi:hypothetical protein
VELIARHLRWEASRGQPAHATRAQGNDAPAAGGRQSRPGDSGGLPEGVVLVCERDDCRPDPAVIDSQDDRALTAHKAVRTHELMLNERFRVLHTSSSHR